MRFSARDYLLLLLLLLLAWHDVTTLHHFLQMTAGASLIPAPKCLFKQETDSSKAMLTLNQNQNRNSKP